MRRTGDADAAPAADRGQFRFAAVAQGKRLMGGFSQSQNL